jgi:hypothetical protein
VLPGGTGESPRWRVGALWGEARTEEHVFPRQGRRPVNGRRAAIATVIALVVTATLVIVGLETADASVPATAISGPVAAPDVLKPPPIPTTGAYLGLDPNYDPGEATSTQARAFERHTGRTLGIVSYYVSFGDVPPFADVRLVAERGSIPMISMNCGSSDAAIAAGKRDGELRADARAFKHYGGPLLFRWFWEMNLTTVNGHAACLGTAGGHGYIAAWRHIWTIFHDVGARNVAFVWCPSDARSAQHQEDLTYFPGNRYVEWIGADLYDRPTAHGTFAQQFAAFYRYWSGYSPHKPLILTETGAVGAPAQARWLGQIARALETQVAGVAGTPFAHVHGVVYVDAIDIANYILHSGRPGIEQYADLAQGRYFSVTSRI